MGKSISYYNGREFLDVDAPEFLLPDIYLRKGIGGILADMTLIGFYDLIIHRI